MGSRVRRPLLPLLAMLTVALAVTGCVSIPNAGPVLSYPVTQQTGGQNGQNLQFTAQVPGSGWSPQQIVSGFLIAAAANQEQAARAYLAPAESRRWNPAATTTTYVYKTRPNVLSPVPQPTAPAAGAASGKKGAPPPETVEVNGKIQAILSTKDGTYAVPSASGPNSSGPQYFILVKTGGEWRISAAPSVLMLTQTQFANDYDLRNLYFFDPTYHYLVPDPVYVPVQASAGLLTTRLVDYLKAPPGDWLAEGATQTAFPSGTKVTATLAEDLATVNVTATGTVTRAQRAQMESQLLWTLVGSGQGGSQVTSVALFVNGKAFYPSDSPVNQVEIPSQASYRPATGAGATAAGQPVYYLDSAGDVYSNRVGMAGVAGQQTRVTKIGPGYTQIAVSQDGKYLAALRSNGDLYIGPLHGPLVPQQGTGYTTLSWDPTDNLWSSTGANDQIFVFRAGAGLNSRQARPIEVTVTSGVGASSTIVTDDEFTALQIAPDGVRVAMILNSDDLTFGAIVWGPGTASGLESVRIQLSFFNVSDLASGFDGVTWNGADNVITLGGPASTVTEYPVNGGTPTSQMLDQTVESITASPGQALIAGVAKGEMIEASNLTGAWATITTGAGTPVKGISPTYPG
jgi:hypothetical protein